jgi:hypothetical protein
MRIGKSKLALIVLCCAVLAFEAWHLRSRSSTGQQQTSQTAPKHKPDFALLPATEIAVYAGRIADPKPSLDNWEPTVADINDLEASLPQIAALSNKEASTYQRIDDPYQYFRQYLAVAVNGKKTIFVNALCIIDPGEDWRKHLIIVMDGGKCFWNAIYDTSTRTFSNLAINGRA